MNIQKYVSIYVLNLRRRFKRSRQHNQPHRMGQPNMCDAHRRRHDTHTHTHIKNVALSFGVRTRVGPPRQHLKRSVPPPPPFKRATPPNAKLVGRCRSSNVSLWRAQDFRVSRFRVFDGQHRQKSYRTGIRARKSQDTRKDDDDDDAFASALKWCLSES